MAPGTVSHLDLFWESPMGAFYEELGSFCRLIRFDKRGTGLSDRPTEMATLEQRTDDIRAVMDAAGSESAVIWGGSEGASMACLFAATYPDRTRSLVVWGGQARWVQTDDYPWGMTPDEHRELVEDCRQNWPSEWYLRGPGAGRKDIPPEELEAMRRTARAAGSPAAVAAYEEMNGQIDTRDILSTIRVPALVVNRSGDPVAHVDAARDLAERIPGARFVELPGESHGFGGVEEELLVLLREFVAGADAPASGVRQLATILFVDVVGSTEQASQLGDARWSEVLSRLYALAERELASYGGKEVDRAGDGLLAVFDGPTRAIRCARALQRGARELGLELRAGVHTGEVERFGDGVRGIAVHVTARVAALAGPSEVLVSSTVRDLVAGAGLAFDDRGLHELKGVDEPRQLFAVAG
jgi:class 3 adenylate cyclase